MSDDRFKDYLFEYRFDGSLWGITIHARSAEEARLRIGALAWAQYRGEVFAKIRVPTFNVFSALKLALAKLRSVMK